MLSSIREGEDSDGEFESLLPESLRKKRLSNDHSVASQEKPARYSVPLVSDTNRVPIPQVARRSSSGILSSFGRRSKSPDASAASALQNRFPSPARSARRSSVSSDEERDVIQALVNVDGGDAEGEFAGMTFYAPPPGTTQLSRQLSGSSVGAIRSKLSASIICDDDEKVATNPRYDATDCDDSSSSDGGSAAAKELLAEKGMRQMVKAGDLYCRIGFLSVASAFAITSALLVPSSSRIDLYDSDSFPKGWATNAEWGSIIFAASSSLPGLLICAWPAAFSEPVFENMAHIAALAVCIAAASIVLTFPDSRAAFLSSCVTGVCVGVYIVYAGKCLNALLLVFPRGSLGVSTGIFYTAAHSGILAVSLVHSLSSGVHDAVIPSVIAIACLLRAFSRYWSVPTGSRRKPRCFPPRVNADLDRTKSGNSEGLSRGDSSWTVPIDSFAAPPPGQDGRHANRDKPRISRKPGSQASPPGSPGIQNPSSKTDQADAGDGDDIRNLTGVDFTLGHSWQQETKSLRHVWTDLGNERWLAAAVVFYGLAIEMVWINLSVKLHDEPGVSTTAAVPTAASAAVISSLVTGLLADVLSPQIAVGFYVLLVLGGSAVMYIWHNHHSVTSMCIAGGLLGFGLSGYSVQMFCLLLRLTQQHRAYPLSAFSATGVLTSVAFALAVLGMRHVSREVQLPILSGVGLAAFAAVVATSYSLSLGHGWRGTLPRGQAITFDAAVVPPSRLTLTPPPPPRRASSKTDRPDTTDLWSRFASFNAGA